MNNGCVLIVDPDEQHGQRVAEALVSWGLSATRLDNPRLLPQAFLDNEYAVLLLECALLDTALISYMAQECEYRLAPKLLLLTEPTQKALAITALSQGAFALLDKPVEWELLQHTVRRAIETREVER